VLVVAINDDESVRQLKGPRRPVNAAADRAAVLDALSYVDYVTVFSGSTPIPLLQLLQPEVYAKGGDYVPEMLAETEIVRGYGGAVQILDYVSTQSTSGIVDQIREGKPALTPRRIARAADGQDVGVGSQNRSSPLSRCSSPRWGGQRNSAPPSRVLQRRRTRPSTW